jgi:hypothetical protein
LGGRNDAAGAGGSPSVGGNEGGGEGGGEGGASGGEAGSTAGGSDGNGGIRDDSTRVDPGTIAPDWGAWQTLGLSSRRVPSSIALDQDTFRVYARDRDDKLEFADFPRDPHVRVVPNWSVILVEYGGLFAGSDATVLKRSVDVLSVALSGYNRILYRAHWNHGNWFGWWLAGPTGGFQDVPVGLMTSPSDVFFAARDLNDELQLVTFDADGYWPEEWPKAGIRTAQQPAVALGDDGVHVMVTDTSGTLRHSIHQLEEEPSSDPTSWSSLPGIQFRSAPKLVARTPTQLDVFARATDDCIYWQTRERGRWLGWVKVSGPVASNALVVLDGPGSFYLFTTDRRALVSGRRFSSAGWTPWFVLGEVHQGPSDEFPGSGLAFGENDVRLVTVGPSQELRMLSVTRSE